MDFFRFESPDTHYLRLVDSRDVKCEMIWSILGRQGLRATVLNFPLMTPPRPWPAMQSPVGHRGDISRAMCPTPPL